MNILGIETSCDETAIAIVADGKKVLAEKVYTQSIHKEFFGVVPELASRDHQKRLVKMIDALMQESQMTVADIDAIAVTESPGLLGSLLVGLNISRALALVWNKTWLPVNHLQGHLYSPFLTQKIDHPFPYLGLVVSGGHTHLYVVENWQKYECIAKTKDDALGEAYDKIAKLLGLGYPGGHKLDQLAQRGTLQKNLLPKIQSEHKNEKEEISFSYSGLKSATRRLIEKGEASLEDIATTFQFRAISHLVESMQKIDWTPFSCLLVAGGASANSLLRKELQSQFPLPVYFPEAKYCTDNAAMIAGVAFFLQERNLFHPVHSFSF